LLRETDGERFVVFKEEYGFSGEFVGRGTAIFIESLGFRN